MILSHFLAMIFWTKEATLHSNNITSGGEEMRGAGPSIRPCISSRFFVGSFEDHHPWMYVSTYCRPEASVISQVSWPRLWFDIFKSLFYHACIHNSTAVRDNAKSFRHDQSFCSCTLQVTDHEMKTQPCIVVLDAGSIHSGSPSISSSTAENTSVSSPIQQKQPASGLIELILCKLAELRLISV